MICSAHGNSVAASAFGLVLVLSCIPGNGASAQPVAGKLEGTQLRFTGEIATAIFELAGGGLIDFRLNQTPNVNALNWDSSNQPGDVRPRPRGHFICMDRWGAPSDAEGKRGMPFHGEAPHVSWSVINPSPTTASNSIMRCDLPVAGFSIDRNVYFEKDASAILVTEVVTNRGPLGRIYNFVQHPSIAPPYLNEYTRIDSNATAGFSQSGNVPDSSDQATLWPKVVLADQIADLRTFRNNGPDGSDVSSFVFSSETQTGWVTAIDPSSGLLLGYLWPTADYPWLNIWRQRANGQVVARGLEFGTTGYHQPYSTLIKQHQILGRPLYDYLDCDQSRGRTYVVFLAILPENFRGVASVECHPNHAVITEDSDGQRRTLEVKLPKIPWL